MSFPDDYDGIDMAGLDPAWVDHVEAKVTGEQQRRLVAAFPDLRCLYNPGIQQFQIVCREQGHLQGYNGGCGVMVGWIVIPGNYTPPLSMDQVIRQLRLREYVATEACRAEGYANVAEKAEAMAEEIAKAKIQADMQEVYDAHGVDVVNHVIRPKRTLFGYGSTRVALEAKN